MRPGVSTTKMASYPSRAPFVPPFEAQGKQGKQVKLAAACREWSGILGGRRGIGWERGGRILRGRRR
jgi:hypothetical protein